MISSVEDVDDTLRRASGFAQRFLEKGDMADFVRAVGYLGSLLDSPFRISAAPFGIALLCEEKADSLLDTDIKAAEDFFKKAAKYYFIAAAMPDDGGYNSSRAKVSLATLIDDCLIPVNHGEDRDKVSFDLCLEAANAGYAEGQMSVAAKFYAGRGVEKSLPDALFWMKEAQKNKAQLCPDLQAEADCAIIVIESDLAAENLSVPAGRSVQDNSRPPTP